MGLLFALFAFVLQFALLAEVHFSPVKRTKLERVRFALGNVLLAVIGSISTVSNIRGVWNIIDSVSATRKVISSHSHTK